MDAEHVDVTALLAERDGGVLRSSTSQLQSNVVAGALAEAERSVADLERSHADVVAAARDANADDEHDPEGATIAFEREQVAALLAQARRRVEDLRAALERARTGAYGRCESCGEPIGAARLEARPSARTCIACASRR